MNQWALRVAGVAGPVLFTMTWLVEGALRPEYDPTRDWVSELSLGDRGPVMVAAFVLSGLLVVGFALGLRHVIPDGPGSRWGPRLVALAGIALAASGVFVTDPGIAYPPGAARTTTWHGTVHSVTGPVVFGALAAAAFVLARRRGTRVPRKVSIACGAAVLAFWIAAGVLVTLDYAGQWTPAPSGLAERVSLVTGFGWLALLAARVHTDGPVR